MKRTILIALALIILVIGGYLLSQWQGAAAVVRGEAVPTPNASISSAPDVPAGEVEALGRVVPAQHEELHFRTNGVIQELAVQEGQDVKEGDVLARLRDEKQMKLAVSQARLEVIHAEKAYSDLELNAPMQAAQAFYDMTLVEKELEKVQKRRTAMEYPKATKEEIGDAHDAYKKADDAFKQAQDYFQPSDDIYKGAKANRNNLLSTYNWLISKYSDLEKREVEANYQLLERKYAELERLYGIYSKGADPEELTLAEARLEVAKDQLAAAEAGYEDLVLRAPFSGEIVKLNLEEGEIIAAGQPLLTLADLSHWNIETEDLTELSVIQINEGDEAQIWIDALPETTFEGIVTKINKIGETRRGDITYTVVIELAESDSRLRWNMTSPITIVTGE